MNALETMKEYTEILDLTESGLREVVRSDRDFKYNISVLYELLHQLLTAAGRKEGLHFTSLFARIAYISTTRKWSTSLTRAMHQFRIAASDHKDQSLVESRLSLEDVLFNGLFCVGTAYAVLGGRDIPDEVHRYIPKSYPKWGYDVIWQRAFLGFQALSRFLER